MASDDNPGGPERLTRELQRLLEIATAVGDAEFASFWHLSGEHVRHFASVGIESEQCFRVWKWEQQHGSPHSTHFAEPFLKYHISQTAQAIIGPASQGVFTRLPVYCEGDNVVGLLLMMADKAQQVPLPMQRLLKDVAKSMTDHAKELISLHRKSNSRVTVQQTFDDLCHDICNHPHERFLLDKDLRVLASSVSSAEKLGLNLHTETPMFLRDLRMPAYPTFELLCKNALETSCSSPEVNISEDAEGFRHMAIARANPVRPMGYHEDLLQVTCVNHRSLALNEHGTSGISLGVGAINPVDMPTEAFLFDTLVRKRILRSRGPMSYVTLRTWNKAIREYQINALKALVRSSRDNLAHRAAKECAKEIASLVGAETFKFIVPVPEVYNETKQTSFSQALALALGAEFRLPVINAFAHLAPSNGAKSKDPLKRPKMRLVEDVPGPAILLDDVATTGQHIGEAAAILKAKGVPCFSFAWISGEP